MKSKEVRDSLSWHADHGVAPARRRRTRRRWGVAVGDVAYSEEVVDVSQLAAEDLGTGHVLYCWAVVGMMGSTGQGSTARRWSSDHAAEGHARALAKEERRKFDHGLKEVSGRPWRCHASKARTERMGEIDDGRWRCFSPAELVHTRKEACEEGDDAGLRLEEKKRDLD